VCREHVSGLPRFFFPLSPLPSTAEVFRARQVYISDGDT